VGPFSLREGNFELNCSFFFSLFKYGEREITTIKKQKMGEQLKQINHME
jgi:hypothetical protein